MTGDKKTYIKIRLLSNGFNFEGYLIKETELNISIQDIKLNKQVDFSKSTIYFTREEQWTKILNPLKPIIWIGN